MGLGAFGAISSAAQLGQISGLEQKVDNKAKATSLALLLSRIKTLETEMTTSKATISTLSSSSTTATSSLTSICTAVF